MATDSFARFPRAALRSPLFCAVLCTALVLTWQFATVHFNYHDDWSALFYTGSYTQIPPELAREGTYRIANDPGFDGQFYHFIAHDPFLRRDTAKFVDSPGFRWRRSLVPVMAWALALGQRAYIDSTYALSVLFFVFLGTWWTSRLLLGRGLSPLWSLLYPLIPAVLVSIDRNTVDVALTALVVGFLVEEGWRLALVLALAPLARETGLALPLAYGLHALLRRDGRALSTAAAATVPYLLWIGYLATRTPFSLGMGTSPVPFTGLWRRTVHVLQYPAASLWLRTAAALDYLAVLAMWLAIALTVCIIARRAWDRAGLAAAVFAATFAAFVSQPDVWYGAYTFARTMSPLLMLLAAIGLARRSWIYGLPVAASVPRILWQLEPQWRGIWHGVKLAIRATI